MYVCPITFESLDVGTSYSHIQRLGVKYIDKGDQSHKSKIVKKCVFPQCKIFIAHNSSSIKDRAMKFVCSMGVFSMTD